MVLTSGSISERKNKHCGEQCGECWVRTGLTWSVDLCRMRTGLTWSEDLLLSMGLGILMSKCSERIIWLLQPLMITNPHNNFHNIPWTHIFIWNFLKFFKKFLPWFPGCHQWRFWGNFTHSGASSVDNDFKDPSEDEILLLSG